MFPVFQILLQESPAMLVEPLWLLVPRHKLLPVCAHKSDTTVATQTPQRVMTVLTPMDAHIALT